jgi:histidinol-phosphate aminotransferase
MYGEPDFPAARDIILSGAPVIGLRTFSKMYGLAGLRVGFGVAAPELIRLLNQTRSPFNVNLAAQTAAAAAINDDEFVAAGKSLNAGGLSQLTSGFARLGLTWIPSHANFVMVDVRRPCRQVFDALLRRGVIIRTGDIFGMPTHIRVTIGTADQNERFLNELESTLSHISETTP